MTLTQMRYFYEVCRWQNISQAAEKLHVSQPTISASMQALERETGLNLFHREKNRIVLTPESNQLLGRVSSILKRADQLERDIENIATQHNRIRMAMPLQLSVAFLPAIFGDFCLRYPNVQLEIMEMGGVTALHMVEKNKLDFALTSFSASADDRLVYHKILDCECCFCTWPEHSLSGRKTVTMEDIAEEPLVMLDNHFFIYHLVHENFAKYDCRPNIIHYTPYLHTAKNLVRQHLASTLLIRQGVLPDEPLVLIPLKEPLYLDVGIVTKKDRQIYPDERTLMDYLKEIAR